MNIKDLPSGYYLFGNKGAMWNDKAHAAAPGQSVTLCGKPMLSTNWCRIEGIKEVKCTTCLEKLKEVKNE